MIFDVLKAEKESKKIQKVDENFYKRIAEFIAKRKRILENIKEETEEIKKLKQEIENIKLAVKEIYDLREKKILSLALLASRENVEIAEENNLSFEEKVLFKLISFILKFFRENVLNKAVEGEITDISKLSEELNKLLKGLRIKAESSLMVLRILREVPKFVGTDMKVYGPYQPEEIVLLPKEIGEMLKENEYAEECSIQF